MDCVYEWPPHSPDLTPLDFCLWGHVKALVYSVKIQDVVHLADRIVDACATFSQMFLVTVHQEWEKGVTLTLAHGGQHIKSMLKVLWLIFSFHIKLLKANHVNMEHTTGVW